MIHTMTGTLEFRDIGPGEWYLITPKEKFRLLGRSLSEADTNVRLKTALSTGQPVTVHTSEADSTAVTGGTTYRTLVVRDIE